MAGDSRERGGGKQGNHLKSNRSFHYVNNTQSGNAATDETKLIISYFRRKFRLLLWFSAYKLEPGARNTTLILFTTEK